MADEKQDEKLPPAQKPGSTVETPQGDTAGDVPKSWDDIFNHPRFKSLLERAKTAEDKLAKYDAERSKAEKLTAEQNQKWEQLYRDAEKQKAETQTQLDKVLAEVTLTKKRAALKAAALAHVPPFTPKAAEDAWKFVDELDKLEFDGDKLLGAADVIKRLAAEKDYMLEKPAPAKGTPVGGKPAAVSDEDKRKHTYRARL